MGNDRRYKTINILFGVGEIKKFQDIFDHIPTSVVARDMGTNYNRLLEIINNPKKFTLGELMSISSFIEIDPPILIDLAYRGAKETIVKKVKPHLKKTKDKNSKQKENEFFQHKKCF